MKERSRIIKQVCMVICAVCLNSCSVSYHNLKGEYSNSSIDLTLWLYEDGTYAEHDMFGWYSGYYEYSKSDSNDYIVHLMSRYPPILDTLPTLYMFYQPHADSGISKFVVLDQDGSQLQINNIVWKDSSGNVSYIMEKEGLCEGDIPANAAWIAVNGNGGISSGFVKVREHFDIVFYVRPNFNQGNLRWTKRGGLVYKNDTKKYVLKKSRLHPKLKVSLSNTNSVIQ